ncbi:MAG TPA: hypothetical protein VGR45_07700 [Stellaceae bacterium]|nr:hypothetical protein [Stellaceae bacterium]
MQGWWRGIATAVLVVAASTRGAPAAAQVPGGGADILPPLPESGFGVPSTTFPPNAVSPPSAAPAETPSLRLPAPGAGIVTLQQNEPSAPAILIQPQAAVAEAFTDNARATATNRVADAETRLIPGISISADTPRLQGILSGQVEYDKYAIATDQDQLFGDLFAKGTVTAIPDNLFVDLDSSISQANRFGGIGFAPVSQTTQSQLTQVFTSSLSPYLRKSYDGLVDTELRYRFSATDFGGNTGALATTPTGALIPGVTTTPAGAFIPALSNSIFNEGTATVATGSNFERLLSKLTLDASKLDGGFVTNSRISDYDDVEYRITSLVAALGRIGYENIHYLQVPTATTTGLLWQVGGRLDLGPDGQYVIVRYGKEEGIYGFSGSLRYAVTPATIVTASATQGIGSTQEEIQNNLIDTNLNQYGQLVNQYDQPTAFANPEFVLQNDVVRARRYEAAVRTIIDVNTFNLLAFYERQSSFVTQTPPSTSVGANFFWSRQIRPDLTGNASLGYAHATNLTFVTPTATATLSSATDSTTASLGVNYLFGQGLTGSVVYTLSYQSSAPTTVSSGTIATGNILVNRLEFRLSKTF